MAVPVPSAPVASMKYSAAEILVLGLPPSVIVALIVGPELAGFGVMELIVVDGFPSVKVFSATSPDDSPVAVICSVELIASSGTCHVVEICPSTAPSKSPVPPSVTDQGGRY